MQTNSIQSSDSSHMSLGQARKSFTTDYDDTYTSPLMSPLADEEGNHKKKDTNYSSISSNNNESTTCFSSHCRCHISKTGCIVTTSTAVLLLGILFLLLVNVIGPNIAQSSIKHSTLSLQSCTMHDADNYSIALDCHIRLDNAGGIPAILHSFPVDVLHVSNTGVSIPHRFGRMVMPKTIVAADGPTFVRLSSRLNVTDNAAFTRATAGVLQGNVGKWIVRGDGELDVVLGGASLRFNVHLEKEMLLPPTVLANVTAFDFIVTGSDADAVYAVASCSLLSVSVLELHSLGSMSFALHASLNDPDPGAYVGQITIPDFAVKRGFNEYVNVTAKMHIDPNATVNSLKYNASARAVKHFFTKYAKGENIDALLIGPTWIKSGSPFLLGLVEQNVTVQVPGPFVSDMETSNIQIVAGTQNTLPATADGVFHSASTIRSGALGAITFDLQAPAPTPTTGSSSSKNAFDKTITIGTVTMPSNFGVNPGINYIHAKVALFKDGTIENQHAIATFVNNYAMGKNQKMQLFGPVKHPTAMLNGFLTQSFVASGIANPNLVVGSVLTQESVAGYAVKGGSAPTVASDGKMRGAVAVASNPFNAAIRMKNVKYDIYLHNPIEYKFSNKIWGSATCPKSDKFSRSSFGKGMHLYKYLCPDENCSSDKGDLDYVDFLPNQQVSFLSPAYPMPDQIIYKPNGKVDKCPGIGALLMPDNDCCYLTIFFAAACRALKNGDAHFLTRTNGTMHLTIGDFETDSSIGQDVLSFTFEPGLLDGWKIDGLVTEVPTCEDFTFL